MPRKPMVTRTLTVTVADAVILDIPSQKTNIKTYELPRTYATENRMLRKISLRLPESQRACYISKSRVEKRVYGMSEEKFLMVADLLETKEREDIQNE